MLTTFEVLDSISTTSLLTTIRVSHSHSIFQTKKMLTTFWRLDSISTTSLLTTFTDPRYIMRVPVTKNHSLLILPTETNVNHVWDTRKYWKNFHVDHDQSHSRLIFQTRKVLTTFQRLDSTSTTPLLTTFTDPRYTMRVSFSKNHS